MKYYLLILLSFTVIACSADTNPEEKKRTNPVIEKLQVNPQNEKIIDGLDIAWGFDWLPNGDMLITEKKGKLYRYRGSEKIAEITNLPDVKMTGQGGLMDIRVHPDYENNGWIYFSYVSTEGGGSGHNTAIMRAKIQNNGLVNKELLYKVEPNTGKSHHFGSRIEFDRDGYVYFSVGDRGERDLNPQDYYRDAGKIYRIDDDGSIPESNPFYNEQSAKKAIYSYGHRNPQGMAMNPETGEIWTHEHGPKGGDEVNIIKAGENYGWPEVSYGVNYSGTKFTDKTSAPGMTQPIWYWVPSIAPSGMAFVKSDKYPSWEGDLLVGSLKFGYIMYCDVNGNEITSEKPIFEGVGRVRAIEQGPDGLIYFSVEGEGIYRIKAF